MGWAIRKDKDEGSQIGERPYGERRSGGHGEL